MNIEVKFSRWLYPGMEPASKEAAWRAEKASFEASLGGHKSCRRDGSITQPGYESHYIYTVEVPIDLENPSTNPDPNIKINQIKTARASNNKWPEQAGADSSSVGGGVNSVLKNIITTYSEGLKNGMTNQTIQKIKTLITVVKNLLQIQDSMIPTSLDAAPSYQLIATGQKILLQAIETFMPVTEQGINYNILSQAKALVPTSKSSASSGKSLTNIISQMKPMKPKLQKMADGVKTLCSGLNDLISNLQSNTNNPNLASIKSTISSVS